MTTFAPAAVAEEAAPAPAGPKLVYEIDDEAWIDAGARDKLGNVIKNIGTVVHAFDHQATRFYVVKLTGDYMHMVLRDALLMSPTREEPFPWSKTRHDATVRAPLRQIEWRQ